MMSMASLSDNEILQYDTASSKWINQTLAEADIASAATLSSHTGVLATHIMLLQLKLI